MYEKKNHYISLEVKVKTKVDCNAVVMDNDNWITLKAATMISDNWVGSNATYTVSGNWLVFKCPIYC